VNTVVVTTLIPVWSQFHWKNVLPWQAIPGSLSLTSPGLGIECVVVVVGDYYYSHKTKSIEKRMTKKKREGSGASQDTSERNIKWKAGPDPKENAIQAINP
jgi:hypothetical protein